MLRLIGITFLNAWLMVPVDAQEPFAVVFDNSFRNRTRHDELQQLIADFSGEPAVEFSYKLPALVELAAAMPSGETFAHCSAFWATAQGEVVRAAAFSVPSLEAAEVFSANEQRRCTETGGTVSGSEFRFRMDWPETKEDLILENGRGVLTTSAKSGVLVLAPKVGAGIVSGGRTVSPHVMNLDPSVMVPILKLGSQKDYYLQVTPKAVSKAVKRDYLLRQSGLLSTLMQARDNDPSTTNAARRSWYQLQKELLVAFVEGLDDLRWTSSPPARNRPYEIEIYFQASPDSELAQLVDDLIPKWRHPVYSFCNNPAASGFIRMNSPNALKAALLSQLYDWQFAFSDRLFQASKRTIESGKLNFKFEVEPDDNGRPVMHSGLYVDSEPLPASELAAFFGTVVRENSQFATFDPTFLLPATFPEPYRIHAGSQEDILIFQVASENSDVSFSKEKLTTEKTPESQSNRWVPGRLLELSFDLRKLFNSSQADSVVEIVRWIEKSYHQQALNSKVARAPMLRKAFKVTATDFSSKMDLLADGDWTVKVTVDASRQDRSVKFRMKVGPQLYAAIAYSKIRSDREMMQQFKTFTESFKPGATRTSKPE